MHLPTQQPRLNRRQFLQLTNSVAALALLNACAATPSATQSPATQSSSTDTTTAAAEPKHGGVLRIALSDDVTSLDPATAVTVADIQLGFMLYSTLLRRGEGEAGAPIYAELAESWEVNEDATIHTFHLVKNATFQHGTPLTAKDVEHTMTRLQDPSLGSSVGNSLGAIDKLEIVDDFTIKFHLKVPNVTLPYVLGGPGTQIVPHDRTTEELVKESAGTGAFVLAERVPGERTVLKRNENYWDKTQPYLDEVQLLVLPEPTSQIAALTSGTVDMLFQISVDSVSTLENAPDVKVLESIQGIYPVFVMHMKEKPFDDVRVRQAFKHAVDRAALLQAIMQGRGAIGNDQPIGPGSPFWADVQPLAFDVAKAKALLTEAGYPNGLEVTLSTADIGGPRLNDAAIAIQEMVKAAGITLAINKVPAGEFWTKTYMQVPFFVSWWPVFSEPDGVLPLGYASTGSFNESGMSDPKLDDLIIAGRGEQKAEQRKAVYAEIQQIISEQGGVLVPYFAPVLQAIRNNVQGVIPGARVTYQTLWLAQG